MWIIKFQNWHENCLLKPRCMKYQVTDLVYLLNSWKERNKFYYTELHILQGVEENKRKFIRDLKKEKSIKKLEKKENSIFTLNEELIKKQYYDPIFNPKIIQVKPVIQRTDGYEDWELACWDKKILMEVTKVPTFKVKLKSIENKKLGDIFISHIHPKLPPKQKQAIELAIKWGYYNYPRKVKLEDLAKLSKVRRQTFQENLRRAERKLIPFLAEDLSSV